MMSNETRLYEITGFGWRQVYHYNQNGETYLNVGQAMGKVIVELQTSKK